jgi:hypothetical protein
VAHQRPDGDVPQRGVELPGQAGLPRPLTATVFQDLAHAYQRGIVDAGKEPELFLLVAFLCSFGFIRTSAHMIRSPRFPWWPGNVDVGGTHVHHLVWGIITILIVGYTGIALEPGTPWREVLAILFGIGAGLTLDEFALWLNLKDVYWTPQGRRSIDAVIVAGGGALFVLLGWRVWLDLGEKAANVVRFGLPSLTAVGVVIALVNVLKRKPVLAAVSLILPLVGLIGAIRLARPDSLWARTYGDAKSARAAARFAKDGAEVAPPDGRKQSPVPRSTTSTTSSSSTSSSSPRSATGAPPSSRT